MSKFLLMVLLFAASTTPLSAEAWTSAIDRVQPKIVKIYGAGGIKQLESYQSGFLITPDGYVLTAWSYVLDTEGIVVTLNDGSRFEAELFGADPSLELAVLKVAAEGLDHFDLDNSTNMETGDRVMAFSNLFGIATGNEPTSVLHGQIVAITNLDARRGSFNTPYRGQVYVVDAITNNAGAAGGALTDLQGQLAAIQGKELRDARSGIWLNYAIPVSQIKATVQSILEGKAAPRGRDEEGDAMALLPWRLQQLGFWMIPDVLTNTPPFVQGVLQGSPADVAGLREDDLIIYIDGHLVRSQKALRKEIELVENDDRLTLSVMRNQEMKNITIAPIAE